jgi:hypothetical protein
MPRDEGEPCVVARRLVESDLAAVAMSRQAKPSARYSTAGATLPPCPPAVLAIP